MFMNSIYRTFVNNILLMQLVKIKKMICTKHMNIFFLNKKKLYIFYTMKKFIMDTMIKKI